MTNPARVVAAIVFASALLIAVALIGRSNDQHFNSTIAAASFLSAQKQPQQQQQQNQPQQQIYLPGTTQRIRHFSHCGGRCTHPKQRCFLGDCVCLPGWRNADALSRNGANKHHVDDAPCSVPDFFDANAAKYCPPLIAKSYSELLNAPMPSDDHFPLLRDKCLPHLAVIPNASRPAECAILCYWQRGIGTALVPLLFWRYVQEHEMDYWKLMPDSDTRAEGFSRAAEFLEGFGEFTALPRNLKVSRLLEVGAGPVTQTRLLLEQRPDIHVGHIYLEEPSIIRYLSAGINSTYRDGRLGPHGTPVSLLNMPLEELESMPEAFDMVVIMNVIEHVYDALTFLNQLYSVVRCDGYLVWNERHFVQPNSKDATVLGSPFLHPVRTTQVAQQKLLDLFEPLYRFEFGNTKQAKKRDLGERGTYFIGRKTC